MQISYWLIFYALENHSQLKFENKKNSFKISISENVYKKEKVISM